jgi:hypothetical protein
MAKKKRRRRRKTSTKALMNRAKVAGYTALYAYAKEKSSVAPKMLSIPHVSAIGYDATMMLAAHVLAKKGPSIVRKPMDYLATGLAGKVGYDFGASGFKVQGLGDGGMGGAIGGEVDPGDFDPDDYDDE